jgi:hypothetical protein
MAAGAKRRLRVLRNNRREPIAKAFASGSRQSTRDGEFRLLRGSV